MPVGHRPDVGSRRHFDVTADVLDELHRDSRPLRDCRVVGKIISICLGGTTVGVKDDIEVKSLRCLGVPEGGSVKSAADGSIRIGAFQGVRDRQGRDDGGGCDQCFDGAFDRFGSDERAGGVMDQNGIRLQGTQAWRPA